MREPTPDDKKTTKPAMSPDTVADLNTTSKQTAKGTTEAAGSVKAFVKELNPITEEAPYLYELVQKFGPNYVVRHARKRLEENPNILVPYIDLTDKMFEHVIETATDHISQLRNCKINIPQTYYVVGLEPEETVGNNDKPELFQATEKVEGISLEYWARLNEEQLVVLSSEIKKLLIGLSDYLIQKVESLIESKETGVTANIEFMDDIFRDRQYIFGSTHQDENDKLYLVDTEMLASTMTISKLNISLYFINNFLEEYTIVMSQDDIADVKDKLDDLNRIRDRLKKFEDDEG